MHKSVNRSRLPAWAADWSSKDRDVSDDDEDAVPLESAGFLSAPIGIESFVGFVRDFCEAVNSPRALTTWLLFYYNEHDQLVDPLPVVEWPSEMRYREDYAVTEFLTKCVDLNTSHDRMGKAVETLLLSEDLCRQTNDTFRMRAEGRLLFPTLIEQAYQLARGKMADILGDVPSFDTWEPLCRFGPGADMSTREGATSAYHKFQYPGSATPALIRCMLDYTFDYSGYDALEHAQCVPGNGVFFVLKNAKTFRTAAKEPRWNAWFQSGLGRYIEGRLLRFGQDLHDQSRNQRAASRAHKTGDATVDLKMASDTNAVLFCAEFISPDWFDLLDSLRSPAMRIKGKWVELQKMSSMGNGYTFPLESAIFYSLAWAAVKQSKLPGRGISVYGDDIVLPSEAVPLFLELLRYCGFVPNKDKTHSEGQFFESCGYDFYKGVEVRPFYVKRIPVNAHEQTQLANKLLLWASHRHGAFAHRRFLRAWTGIVRWMPVELRLYGPIGTSGVLHSTLDRCSLKVDNRSSNLWQRRVWKVDAAVAINTRFHGNSYHAHLYSKLRSDMDCGNVFQRRGHWVLKRREVLITEPSDFAWV